MTQKVIGLKAVMSDKGIRRSTKRISDNLIETIYILYNYDLNYRNSPSKIAKHLNIDRHTVLKYCNSGLEAKKLQGRPKHSGITTNGYILNYLELLYFLNPILYGYEVQFIVEETLGLKISLPQICKLRKHYLGLKRKKLEYIARQRRLPQVKYKRINYITTILKYIPSKIIMIDESYFRSSDQSRNFGYFKRYEVIE